uniref:Uncharacterized protein n=1 Tax=Magallana gigas TaxID=29159 RepID=A0A8W8IJY1_MAGGI
EIAEMLPGILNQLGAESFSSLKKLASTVAASGDNKQSTEDIDEDDDGVPELVGNFDETSKGE